MPLLTTTASALLHRQQPVVGSAVLLKQLVTTIAMTGVVLQPGVFQSVLYTAALQATVGLPVTAAGELFRGAHIPATGVLQATVLKTPPATGVLLRADVLATTSVAAVLVPGALVQATSVLLKSGLSQGVTGHGVLKQTGLSRTTTVTGWILRTIAYTATVDAQLIQTWIVTTETDGVLHKAAVVLTCEISGLFSPPLQVVHTAGVLQRPAVLVPLTASSHFVRQPVVRTKIVNVHCAKAMTGVNRLVTASAEVRYAIITVPAPVAATAALFKSGETTSVHVTAELSQSPVLKPKVVWSSFSARGSRR